MTADDLRQFIDAYERAWRTPGIDPLDDLFAESAIYRPAPYDTPIRGRAAIAVFWEAEREGPDEPFTLHAEPVAVQGDTGVARVEVRYAGPPPREYRDLWIVTLDGHGRSTAFEEWPFWPEQPRVAPRG